jgi:hypothetical protein
MSLEEARQRDHTFHFRAAGLAVGGSFEKPFPIALPPQASIVLPDVGGQTEASLDRFDFRGLLSFDRAIAAARGRLVNDVYETVICVSVEGLSVLGVLTADRLTARLVSRHPNLPNAEPAIIPEETDIVNLRLRGKPVKLESHVDEYCRNAKMSEMRGPRFAPPRGKAGAAAEGGAAVGEPTYSDGSRRYRLFTVGGRPRASAALDVTGPTADASMTIDLPGFGRIVIGELLVTRASRRITLLRLELGCPHVGTLTVTQIEGNGSRIP